MGEQMLDTEGQVYFFRDLELIKIGWTGREDVSRRATEVSWSREVEVLACFPGSTRVEAALHRAFQSTRVRGEWFTASFELLALVHYVKKHQRLPAEPEKCGNTGWMDASCGWVEPQPHRPPEITEKGMIQVFRASSNLPRVRLRASSGAFDGSKLTDCDEVFFSNGRSAEPTPSQALGMLPLALAGEAGEVYPLVACGVLTVELLGGPGGRRVHQGRAGYAAEWAFDHVREWSFLEDVLHVCSGAFTPQRLPGLVDDGRTPFDVFNKQVYSSVVLSRGDIWATCRPDLVKDWVSFVRNVVAPAHDMLSAQVRAIGVEQPGDEQSPADSLRTVAMKVISNSILERVSV